MPNRAERRKNAAIQRKNNRQSKVAASVVPRRFGITAPVSISAASSGEPNAKRTFEIDLYTGEPMNIGYWEHPVVIDLETIDLTAQTIPALYDHVHFDPDYVVGQVNRLAIDNGTLKASGYFILTDEPIERNYARKVLSRADAGYQWQASVGGDPKTMECVEAGNTVVVNGRNYPGPVFVARGLAPREASFVILGGDKLTTAVVARRKRNTRTPIKGAAMSFDEWLLSLGFEDSASLSEVQRANLQQLFNSEYPEGETEETPAEPPMAAAEGDPKEEEKPPMAAGARKPRIQAGLPANHIANMRREAAEELRRQSSIREVCAAYSTPTVELTENGRRRKVDLQAHAIAEGWTRDRTELEAHRHQSSLTARTPNIITGVSHPGATMPLVLEASLCMSRRHKGVEKEFKPEVLEAAHKRFRNASLHQLLMTCAVANGYSHIPGERITNSNLREVLRFAVQAGSTVSLPGILGNVANKELLIGYTEEDQTWREVAAIKSVSNFQQVTSYRMLDDMEYEEVGPDGKIKHGETGQESYTRQAKTYAKMYAITRRDLVNDDLGAFDDLRNRIGRGSAKKFNNVFWTEFLSDASTFWTTARGNYITGATTTLLTDGVGLGLGIKAFRQMKSPDTAGSAADGGKRIGGNPDRILVPPELEGAADALYQNQNLGAVATSSANIYANKYRPICVPWLSDSNFTGYSTTAWYLMRDPAILPAIVVSFLNGVENPTVEEAEADFDTLGIQFRGYHDFGCDQAEYLAGVKSKGAA